MQIAHIDFTDLDTAQPAFAAIRVDGSTVALGLSRRDDGDLDVAFDAGTACAVARALEQAAAGRGAPRRLESQADADALLARFADFYDAVTVGFSYVNEKGGIAERDVAVELEARDDEAGTWHRVRFTLPGATAWRFAETGHLATNLVHSLGVGIHVRADGVLLDLAPATERPWTEEDLKASDQFVAGPVCEVEIRPIG